MEIKEILQFLKVDGLSFKTSEILNPKLACSIKVIANCLLGLKIWSMPLSSL